MKENPNNPFASTITLENDFQRIVANNALAVYARECHAAAAKCADPNEKLGFYELAFNAEKIIKQNGLSEKLL